MQIRDDKHYLQYCDFYKHQQKGELQIQSGVTTTVVRCTHKDRYRDRNHGYTFFSRHLCHFKRFATKSRIKMNTKTYKLQTANGITIATINFVMRWNFI